jgi:hypothetical protein
MVIVKVGEGDVSGTWPQFPNLFTPMCSRNFRGQNGMWAVSLDKKSNDNLEVGLHSPDRHKLVTNTVYGFMPPHRS